jgi:kynurenine formamidase
MRIFDLTMGIDNSTPVFPGDSKQEIVQEATIKENGLNKKRLSFTSHFSTHIDAPLHMREGGKSLSDFPIERFIGYAVVIDVRGQKQITPDLAAVKKDDIVFFYTGHTEKAGSKDFFKDNPVITEETAEKLIEKGIRIVGLDSYTPDNIPYTVHKMLFAHDIMIVENLVNLDKLSGRRFRCHIMPLKIIGGDGAPCRVIGTLD